MDIHVIYWTNNRVITRYLTSNFLGHANSTALHNSLDLDEALDGLDSSLLLQLSMDGPNVNKATFRLMQESREHDACTKLLDIGSCSLHRRSSHNLGISTLWWWNSCDIAGKSSMKFHLVGRIITIFQWQRTRKHLPKYSATRWVENVSFSEVIIENLPNLQVQIYRAVNKFPQFSSQNYE